MILPEIYLMIAIVVLIYVLGLWMNDSHVIALGMLLSMFVGLQILIFGIESIRNMTTEIFGMIFLAGGFFILVKRYYDEYKEAF